MTHIIKHTPGPWYRDTEGFIVSDIDNCSIKIVDADCSDVDIDEREANKTLIMAAPELLLACKNARDVFAALITGDLKEIQTNSQTLKMLRYAIKKAEGNA